jgi:hypothetical protein
MAVKQEELCPAETDRWNALGTMAFYLTLVTCSKTSV